MDVLHGFARCAFSAVRWRYPAAMLPAGSMAPGIHTAMDMRCKKVHLTLEKSQLEAELLEGTEG
jgi:hypothetical protein